jgi:hypothetical protein
LQTKGNVKRAERLWLGDNPLSDLAAIAAFVASSAHRSPHPPSGTYPRNSGGVTAAPQSDDNSIEGMLLASSSAGVNPSLLSPGSGLLTHQRATTSFVQAQQARMDLVSGSQTLAAILLAAHLNRPNTIALLAARMGGDSTELRMVGQLGLSQPALQVARHGRSDALSTPPANE